MLNYKGYTGVMEYEFDDREYHGHVKDVEAVIHFCGRTPEEAEKAFRDSVDDYLEWCAERNKKPEKPHARTASVRSI